MKKILSLMLALGMLFSFAAFAEELTGEADGFGGPVTVTITKDGDQITDVKIVGDSETAGIGTNAIDELPQLIIDANGTDVDGVAGATVTSEAILEAANIALGLAEAKAPEEKTVEEVSGPAIGFAMMPNARVSKPRKEGDPTTYSINKVLLYVVFDADGKILYNRADTLEVSSPNSKHGSKLTGWPGQKGFLDAEGKEVEHSEEAFLEEIPNWPTKRELGDGYKMTSGTWVQEMDGFQAVFNGKTVEEVEEWFNKYTSDLNGRPLTDKMDKEEDVKKYSALSDEEKAMLADVTSSATMSIKDPHGDIIGAYRKAYENRRPINKLENASIGFSVNTSGRVGPGKDDKGTQVYSINEVYAAVMFDKDGKVLDVYVDQLEVASPNYDGASMPHFSGYPGSEPYNSDLDHDGKVDESAPEITAESFLKEVAEWATKRERGDGYRMGTGTWSSQMDAFEKFFTGKTVEEIEEWFNKYTAANGRPLKSEQKNEKDQAKYDALSDEEKAMLADVTSSATMSLKDSHGDILGALKEAYENREDIQLTVGE
ncbi:MAG: FMN-binding protein [Eubacteriales bacterium]|nr:FMN-binding protein [Eubacteriales bacterium]